MTTGMEQVVPGPAVQGAVPRQPDRRLQAADQARRHGGDSPAGRFPGAQLL